MPSSYPRDRFDDIPHASGRVGAHRAEQPGMRAHVVLLWAIVATIVLVVAGILGFLYLSKQGGLTAATNDPAPTTSSAQPVDDAVLDTSYSVLVLNGTATEGLDAEIVEQLVAAGFEEGAVVATTSTVTDFEATTVFYATAEDASAAQGVADAIGGAQIAQSDAYESGDGTKELTVVVGLDRVSGE